MKYQEFTSEDVVRLAPYFSLRPNRSCDSAPLCTYIYRHGYTLLYCLEEECLTLMFCDSEGRKYGFLPYCREELLPAAFARQKEHFNSVLQIPLNISYADENGVRILKEANMLNGFEVKQSDAMKDYLYDAEGMRTLEGSKYSKKRNHIRQFERSNKDCWYYRTLQYEDRQDILNMLDRWEFAKKSGQSGEDPTEIERLNNERAGILDVLTDPLLFSWAKIGGIYVNGELAAFSIGSCNPAENMAVIDIEKADSRIHGLYQMMSREFLRHEFPRVAIVNREDDMGVESIRKAKMSSHPNGFAIKYVIRQQ